MLKKYQVETLRGEHIGETHWGNTLGKHMKGKLKKLQRELEETTQLQVEKMTLEIKLQEMEEKMRSGGMEIATPKTDRKLNKVYGICGKFYGKQKEENDGESSRSRCVIISQ